ncbi:MAG: mismatch repair protein, partial [Terracidiphilus sp.]
VEEVLARQAAVRELGPKVKFREKLASCGEDVRAGVDPERLAAWGESGPVLTTMVTRVAATVLGLAWLASLAAWPLYGTWLPLVLVSVANVAYAHRIFSRWGRAAEAIEKAVAELRLLAEVLALFEREEFAATKLKELQAKVRREGVAASRLIRRLARLADTIEGRHNLMVQLIDPVLFFSAQFVFLAETWQRRYGRAIRVWLESAGELEALASLAAFAYEHPEYAFAEFAGEGPLFEAEELAHPLLLPGKAVGNDVRLDGGSQAMILSGPNMAGKSTFIRCIGVNAVLAQCGAPACARKLRMSPLRVAASICVLDSLSGGVSRFYAEIRRVKAIADMAEGSVPVLFLLDELLSGTNSHDRLKGTEFVVGTLAGRRAIGVVSTHDLALTRIPEAMGVRAFNAHFEDRLAGDALVFDFRLRPGPVETSNALKLMRGIGLGVDNDGRPAAPAFVPEGDSNR